MLYIHQHSVISPQQTFGKTDLETLVESKDNQLKAIEPAYEGIPPGILRRMGKAVRMGVGAALPIVKSGAIVDGIIIGTSNGGMEDCIKFLNQIIDYDEGMLTPGNFVQSTPNAIAGQLGLMTKNRSYNITHVHRGLAFETALIDAAMKVKENPGSNYLLGAVDEISSYNFNIDFLDGWYKKETVSNKDLYESQTAASIAGEGSAIFLVNDRKEDAVAHIKAISTLHTKDEEALKQAFERFIATNLTGINTSTLLLSGENGDSRLLKFYQACESTLSATPVIRYKHMTGEYPTSSSFAFWLACRLLSNQQIPGHIRKSEKPGTDVGNILLYNNYKGAQHVFALLTR